MSNFKCKSYVILFNDFKLIANNLINLSTPIDATHYLSHTSLTNHNFHEFDPEKNTSVHN